MITAFRFCLLWRPHYWAGDGPGQAGPERSPRRCWLRLSAQNTARHPERAFNPERQSQKLR